MGYTKREFCTKSSDGIHTLAGVVYIPDGEIRGIYHTLHGMTEHIARYDAFMATLAENGYLACGYDHIGHGYTARNDSELGFFAKKDGYDILCRDVKVFADAIVAEFGNHPYILMGHSMGSFIARVSASKYIKPDKLVIMGTGGKNPAADAGIALASVIGFFCGKKHKSKLIDSVAFGSYNKKFGGKVEGDKSLWLTTDKSVRDIYYADKFCTFKFTVSAMKDLIKLIKLANSKDFYKNIDKSMPILINSGMDDPVGNYAKGIMEIKIELDRVGANSIVKLYSGARHEILNDFCRDKVISDILEFCNN